MVCESVTTDWPSLSSLTRLDSAFQFDRLIGPICRLQPWCPCGLCHPSFWVGSLCPGSPQPRHQSLLNLSASTFTTTFITGWAPSHPDIAKIVPTYQPLPWTITLPCQPVSGYSLTCLHQQLVTLSLELFTGQWFCIVKFHCGKLIPHEVSLQYTCPPRRKVYCVCTVFTIPGVFCLFVFWAFPHCLCFGLSPNVCLPFHYD